MKVVSIFLVWLFAAVAAAQDESTYEKEELEDLAWDDQLPEAMRDYNIKGGQKSGPTWLDYEDASGEHMCLTVSNTTLDNDEHLRRELLKWDSVLHGCWCGKGKKCNHVVDTVDAACRQHDKCYDKTGASIGKARCHCERNMVAKQSVNAAKPLTWIDPISKLPLSPKAKAVAAGAAVLFSHTPCKCRTCVKYPCCRKWKCKWCKKCKTITVPSFGMCLWD